MSPSTRFCSWTRLGLFCALVLLSACRGDAIDPAADHPIPPFTIPPLGEAHEFCFVLGDMGTGREDQYRVAEVMAARARHDPPAFLITVGDNFYESGVDSPRDPQFWTSFHDVYDDPALAVPVHPTLGNHDHRGDPDAQVAHSQEHPLWRMPARHYSFSRSLKDGTRIDFFALDTTPIEEGEDGSETQAGWLSSSLTRSEARWKIVFGHHPLYSSGDHGGSTRMREALEQILEERKADLYLAGHDHHMEVLKPTSSVLHVVAGAAGGPDKAYPVTWGEQTIYAATGGGILLLRLERDLLLLEFIRMDGKTQYATLLEKHGFK
ncbi:MAG: metallophosphoesterase [Planctomycetota bacterium]